MTEVCYGCARDVRVRQSDGRIVWHGGTKIRQRGRKRRWCVASATKSSKWRPPASPKPSPRTKAGVKLNKAILKEVVRARRKKA